jgi:small-conductance mechanosensitive channel
MLLQWAQVLTISLQNLWVSFIYFLPSFLGAIIIFIIGWVIADVVGKAIKQVFDALKVDKLFASAGAEEVVHRAGFKFSVGGFIGWVVKWFIIIVFLMASLEILGLSQVNMFLREVVLTYIPQVVIAALILLAASVLSEFAARITSGTAKAANVRSAAMLGTIVKYAIWIFAFIIALAQLGVAPEFMQILFTALVAALALAFGLSFGLGGRDAASRAIEHFRSETHSE